MSNLIHIQSATELDAYVGDDAGVVLVYFSAAWCAPCKHLLPLLEKILEEEAFSSIKLCKIDVDAHNELAARFNVRSIPTLYLYAGGEQKAVQLGLVDYERLKSFVGQAFE